MNFLFHYMARWKAVNWTRYHELFVNLARMGHTVHVLQAPSFTASQETNFQEIQVELPQRLHLHDARLNSRLWNARVPLKKLFNKGYYSCRSVSLAGELIKEHKIDVLVVYNIPQYPLLGLKNCIKVFDVADDYPAMLKQELGRFSNPLVLKAGERLLHSMIRKSDLTLVVSSVLKESFPQELRPKLTLLPNGVAMRQFAPTQESEAIRARYPAPIIGFIGSFEYFIDFELILESAQRLKAYTFLLVGSGRETPMLQREIQARGLRNVVLTGAVPHQDIAQYIGAMDVCLNIFKPIRISHAACPIKLFEYLAMKKPVISTRLEEVLRLDRGFLSYADTPDELCAAVKAIIDDKETAARRAEAAYAFVNTEYDWPVLAGKFCALLEGLKKS